MSSFQLIEHIGKGSHGHVYKGIWNNKTVAIKQISRSNHTKSQWMNEINVMKTLKEYNMNIPIPKVYSSEVHQDYMYIIMDYLVGDNGTKVLQHSNKTKLYPAASVMKRWMYDICKVCYHTHQLGVLYNDFKPQNIILKGSELHVVDFGSCREFDPKDIKLIGTPFFYSPEKCENAYGFKADVWAIAITMYMMGCGIHPFLDHKVENMYELQHLLHINKLDFHLPQWDQQDSEFLEILSQMLQKEESKRPTIAKILSHDYFEDLRVIYPMDYPVEYM